MDTATDDVYVETNDPYLQVATIANSKFYSATSFDGAPTKEFTLLSSSTSDTAKLWTDIMKLDAKDVSLW